MDSVVQDVSYLYVEYILYSQKGDIKGDGAGALLSPVLSFTSEPTPSPLIPPISLIPYLFMF